MGIRVGAGLASIASWFTVGGVRHVLCCQLAGKLDRTISTTTLLCGLPTSTNVCCRWVRSSPDLVPGLHYWFRNVGAGCITNYKLGQLHLSHRELLIRDMINDGLFFPQAFHREACLRR